ncbi:MAG: type II toxin-antitoxin system PemK/MazF family toxin, partial [Verrucomicrobiota bacterium]
MRVRLYLAALSALASLFAASRSFASVTAAVQADTSPRSTGTPFMQVWRTEDFEASTINWRVLPHPSGLIYIANNFGVLEFDGATWRLIPMPREGAARTLAVDRDGRVWAAGNGDLCVLERDGTGALRARDLTPQLPAGDRVFGTINRAAITTDGVYLSGERRIFLFRYDGTVRVWRTEGNFGPIWQLGDAVHVARDFRELVRLRNDGGADVLRTFAETDPPLLRTLGTVRDGDDWVLFTRSGPQRWKGDASEPQPLSPRLPEIFASEPARAMVRLDDGRYLAATIRGLVVLDAQGRFQQRIDARHGLPSDTVNGLETDAEGGVWLAMQSGVARLQLDSPFALHGTPQGVDSGPRRFARWQDQLYVTLGSGLAVRNAGTGRFQPVPGVRSGANRPLVIDDRLLISASTGVTEILKEGGTKLWSRHNGIPLVASKRAPGWLFHGDSDGLWLMEPTPAPAPGWRVAGRLVNLPANIVQIEDTNDGYIWVVGSLGEIWRIDYPASGGREQAGLRPGLVLQDDAGFALRSPLVLTIPLT